MLYRPSAFVLGVVAALVTTVATVASAAPVIIPAKVGDVLKGQGTGLCIAQAISMDPPMVLDFITLQNKSQYTGHVNEFMEAHKMDRQETVLRTLFDLSNNNSAGAQASYGDFTNAAATCKLGGCSFIINDTTTVFGLRARGYLNVTVDIANKNLHIGLYSDASASLTFYGKDGALYPVITRPAVLDKDSWRTTNTVTFQEPGLYPLEILFADIAEHRALELSYKVDDKFMDFERSAEEAPVVKLKGAGFELFPPEMFSQTLSGSASFADVNKCQQCERQFVNLPGNNGCPEGYYCNDAALCAPCDSAKVCGPSCSPCGGTTPFCINLNSQFQCVGCTEDSQCGDPKCHCNPMSHSCECFECTEDADCAKGQICEGNACIPCDTLTECAGNSCNCCPKTAEGKQLTCGILAGDTVASCVECTKDADCEGKKCDEAAGRCVDQIFPNNTSDCCGDTCAKCPENDPVTGKDWFCMPSHIGVACAQCRTDMDCGDGKYCRSGACDLCLEDRRCGVRCDSCGGDTPFCNGTQVAENGACVRCLENAHCGEGGECDAVTHQCKNTCPATCGTATPYCFGDQCVECYADTQCPCGGTCRADTHTCSTSCVDNGDCQASEHCRWTDDGQTKECTLGQMPDDVGCGSTLGQLCQKSSIGAGVPSGNPLPLTGVIVASGALFAYRRRRQVSRADSDQRRT